MFIEPIQTMKVIEGIGDLQKNEKNKERTSEVAQVPFKSIFADAIEDVKKTADQVNIDAEKLATGKSDDLHQYAIDITKAQVSLEFLVELRNRTLEAYNEVMRMGI